MLYASDTSQAGWVDPTLITLRTNSLMHTSLHYLSLSDAARLVERRLVSPVELTRAMLDRIEEHDAHLHAFITLTPEQALAEARTAEAEIMAGRYRGPMPGIPIAYTDNVETQGVRNTAPPARTRVMEGKSV